MSEEKEKKPDYIVSLPDLAGKTYPASVFKNIANAADAMMANGWTSVVTDGFVLTLRYRVLTEDEVVDVREAAEMLPKAAVLENLHEIGKCGLDSDPYAAGWAKALDEAYGTVNKMKGVMA